MKVWENGNSYEWNLIISVKTENVQVYFDRVISLKFKIADLAIHT